MRFPHKFFMKMSKIFILIFLCFFAWLGLSEISKKEYLYLFYENGNLSSTTGAVSDFNKGPIRSIGFISISDFISATIDEEFRVRYFAYDNAYDFLGTTAGVTEITSDLILNEYPACEYVKIIAVSRDKTALRPALTDDYGLTVMVKSEYKERTILEFNMENFAEGRVKQIDGKDIKLMNIYLDQKDWSIVPRIISLHSKYHSQSDSYPAAQIYLINDSNNELYYSPVYHLGNQNDQYGQNEWRVPPAQGEYDQIKVSITIPEDVVLYIDKMDSRNDKDLDTEDAILYHAHQGFSGLCGPSTLYSFKMAGEMGYQSCITIPHFTSDGVCVCFHDDTTIRNRLRYLDGSTIEEGSKDDRPVSEFTYDELMRFDAGWKKSRIYAGEKVPTLDEFFEICAQYNMAPVLSVHSDPAFFGESGRENFSYIRKAAEKWNVLEKLRIKSANPDIQKTAVAVFGHDIAGYILIQAQTSSWDPLTRAKKIGLVNSNAKSIKESEYSVVMEYFYAVATDEKINQALDEGFSVSIATTGNGIDGPELERLIDTGVTEFTIDHHCSMGLNW